MTHGTQLSIIDFDPSNQPDVANTEEKETVDQETGYLQAVSDAVGEIGPDESSKKNDQNTGRVVTLNGTALIPVNAQAEVSIPLTALLSLTILPKILQF